MSIHLLDRQMIGEILHANGMTLKAPESWSNIPAVAPTTESQSGDAAAPEATITRAERARRRQLFADNCPGMNHPDVHKRHVFDVAQDKWVPEKTSENDA